MTSTAVKRLQTEYRQLIQQPTPGIIAGPHSDTDMFTWDAVISGPSDTPYQNALYKARLQFPRDYPLSPPSMKFLPGSVPYHPNIYSDGRVCISILHPPGDDPMQYEQANERWSPVQSVEKVLLSVVSMLAEPNDESPANVEAARLWRTDRAEFDRRVDVTVRQSLGLIANNSAGS